MPRKNDNRQAFKSYRNTDCSAHQLAHTPKHSDVPVTKYFFNNLNNLVNTSFLGGATGMQSSSFLGAPISTWSSAAQLCCHKRLQPVSKKRRLSTRIQPAADTCLQSHSTAWALLLQVPSSKKPRISQSKDSTFVSGLEHCKATCLPEGKELERQVLALSTNYCNKQVCPCGCSPWRIWLHSLAKYNLSRI